MTKKFHESIRLYLRQEPGRDRWQRMWICAIVGFVAVTIYAWTMSTINLITLPREHLSLDWHRLWFYWSGLSFIAGMEGLLVGWFTEHYEGIFFGWLLVEVLLFIGYLVFKTFFPTNSLIFLISIISYLEMAGALILLAVTLRLTANKFITINNSEDRISRRKQILTYILGISTLVFLIGSLTRFDQSVIRVIRSMNDLMATQADTLVLESNLPLDTIPELRTYLGKSYKIYPRPASDTVGTYILAVVFPDGFSFSCRVSVTEYLQVFYFKACHKGVDLTFP